MDFNNDFLNQKNHSHIDSPPNQSRIKPIEVKINKPKIHKPLSKEEIEKSNQEKRERVIKLADIKKTSDYSEYNSLNINQRNSIDCTNYWRVMNGQSFINVPISDFNFWYYFDERCFGLAERFQSSTKEAREQKLKREEQELARLSQEKKLTKKPVKEDKLKSWLNSDFKGK
jgi:hypothetical protein